MNRPWAPIKKRSRWAHKGLIKSHRSLSFVKEKDKQTRVFSYNLWAEG